MQSARSDSVADQTRNRHGLQPASVALAEPAPSCGLDGGYTTAAVGLQVLSIFSCDYSIYASEAGTYTAQDPRRRHLIYGEDAHRLQQAPQAERAFVKE